MITGDVIPPAVSAVSDHNLLTDLTVGQLIAVVATIGIIIGFIRAVNPVMHRLNNLMDDWFGEQQRPGVPERKGVMQRLEDQDEVLASLRHKVEPIVDDTAEGNHQEVLAKLEQITQMSHSNTAHLTKVERLLHRHIRESKAWITEVDKAAAERDFEVPKWPDLPDHQDD
jgi:hypothetical protein